MYVHHVCDSGRLLSDIMTVLDLITKKSWTESLELAGDGAYITILTTVYFDKLAIFQSNIMPMEYNIRSMERELE